MSNKTLEEIFYKGGKFVKENGEEIKVKPIGEKIIFLESAFSRSKVLETFFNKEYSEANAYFVGSKIDVNYSKNKQLRYRIPVQFYKISDLKLK